MLPCAVPPPLFLIVLLVTLDLRSMSSLLDTAFPSCIFWPPPGTAKPSRQRKARPKTKARAEESAPRVPASIAARDSELTGSEPDQEPPEDSRSETHSRRSEESCDTGATQVWSPASSACPRPWSVPNEQLFQPLNPTTAPSGASPSSGPTVDMTYKFDCCLWVGLSDCCWDEGCAMKLHIDALSHLFGQRMDPNGGPFPEQGYAHFAQVAVEARHHSSRILRMAQKLHNETDAFCNNHIFLAPRR